MKLILSTHNVTLTKAIEDHILTRIDQLDHLDRWAIDARVIGGHFTRRDSAGITRQYRINAFTRTAYFIAISTRTV